MERIEHRACFGGWQEVHRHRSAVLGCDMKLAVYLPPQARLGPCPVLYWLSGLTCSEQNFITKAGAQRMPPNTASILVAPDTSPRGEGRSNDADGYDLGKGAGFYLNATQAPWVSHYRMYDYVVDELPALVERTSRHHGARDQRAFDGRTRRAGDCALRNPGRYRSVSAFSPIVAPSTGAVGAESLRAYLGEDQARVEGV
jgi:S-formylglutathione hydrolase